MSVPGTPPASSQEDTAVVAAAPEEVQQRFRRSEILEALSGRYRLVPILAVLIVIWAVFTLQEGSFLSSRNLSNLLLQTVVTGVLALGLIFVLLIGEIDLSVAATSAACAAVAGLLVTQHDWAIVPAIVVAVISGAAVGAVQGLVITFFGAPAFLITLGSSLALQGALLWILPAGVGEIPLLGTPFDSIGSAYLSSGLAWTIIAVALVGYLLLRLRLFRRRQQQQFSASVLRDVIAPAAAVAVAAVAVMLVLSDYQGVPAIAGVFLLLVVVAAFAMSNFKLGLYLYAIGGNQEAARRAGISVDRLRIVTFMLAGALAAVAGILAASRVLGVTVDSGGGTLLLEAIAAAVIGGTSLFGGRGTVWAALIGALVIGSISNGMDLLGVATEVKYVVEGFILALATVLDAVISRGSLLGRR